jgi:hypothetical protein
MSSKFWEVIPEETLEGSLWEHTDPTTSSLDLQVSAPSGVLIGAVAGIAPNGTPLVLCLTLGRADLIEARTMIPVSRSDVGREAVLAFESGDPSRPIILGLLAPPHDVTTQEPNIESIKTTSPIDVTADGERLVLSAEREIELRCGKASITLTRAGKVIIRGSYVLSRSTGANCVKGASIQLN